MSEYQKAFGKNVRRLRLLRGMTQEKLADRANLSLQHVGAIERGTGNPTLLSMERISVALRVSIEELFAFEEFMRSPAEIREDLLRQLSRIPDAEVVRLYACNKLLLSEF
ncbi:MAG: helix-turn-helix domain-containing protein [Desulfovibrionaceae bacterium]|nr:helix-turn-helix domain-containing protein [Desulfovibrionaceae bacterium]